MTDQEKQQQAIAKWIGQRLVQEGFPSTENYVNGIVAVTNILWDRGYRYSYMEVTNWIFHENQRKILQEKGLKDFLHLMTTANMGPIKRKPMQGRNEPCDCGSGMKFKACCLSKYK